MAESVWDVQQYWEVWRNEETMRWHVASMERTLNKQTRVTTMKQIGVSKKSFATDKEASLAATTNFPGMPTGDELRERDDR